MTLLIVSGFVSASLVLGASWSRRKACYKCVCVSVSVCPCVGVSQTPVSVYVCVCVCVCVCLDKQTTLYQVKLQGTQKAHSRPTEGTRSTPVCLVPPPLTIYLEPRLCHTVERHEAEAAVECDALRWKTHLREHITHCPVPGRETNEGRWVLGNRVLVSAAISVSVSVSLCL